jgi:hypothetical protein
MSQNENRSIRINLDISVPVGGEVHVRENVVSGDRPSPPFAPNISHPSQNADTTLVKSFNGRNHMCAFGGTDSGVIHVFAKVYDDGAVPTDLSQPPVNDLDTLWTRPVATVWRFPLLYVPGQVGNSSLKTLVVWSERSNDYDHETRTFRAVASTYTYCETYGMKAEAATASKPAAKDWSILPNRWQFQVAGVSNASSPNCACLNGTWLLQREGGALLWRRQLEACFGDAKRTSWWRLSFNPKDGFWYLESVGDLGQPAGASIAYRRHESAWIPCGSNDLLLLTNHGYCNVPEFVTLYPA